MCTTRTADENDAGSERVGASFTNPPRTLCSHWPCTDNSKSRSNHRGEKSVPTGARRALFLIGLRLLECVVNRNGKCRVGLTRELANCLGHTLKKKTLCTRSAAMT